MRGVNYYRLVVYVETKYIYKSIIKKSITIDVFKLHIYSNVLFFIIKNLYKARAPPKFLLLFASDTKEF